jgi:hypothetical protein
MTISCNLSILAEGAIASGVLAATNVSNNSGWIFSNAPANAAGSFFFMF